MKNKEVYQPTSPELNHHRKKALKLITQLTKTQKSKKSEQLEYKVRTLQEINKEIEFSMKRNPILAQIFATDQLIIYIRYYFVQNISKCACLSFFRIIMVSEAVTRKYLAYNIPFYIARLIQRQQNKLKAINHQEQIQQALKLLSDWVQKYPVTFPKLLVSTLISFGQLPVIEGFQQKKKDHIPLHLKQQTIDILINLSTKNAKLFAYSGGFNLLSNALMDPSLSDKTESIIYRFIYFFNQKKNRQIAGQYIQLKKIFSIFTDLDNIFAEDASKLKGNMQNSTKFQKQLQQGKQVVISLMKSWTGIIYIGHEQTCLRSFLQALKQIPKKQDSQVRRTIFSIIQQILSIGDKLITSQNIFIQQNQFRVSNLINCYVITLIQLLIDNDLFNILVELSSVQQNAIAQPSQKLLKKLSIYVFNFLPDSSKYIDFLISAATKTDSTSMILKSSSSFIMNKIGNYIYDTSSNKIKNQQLNQIESLFNLNSIYVPLGRSNINAISKTLNFLTYRQKDDYKRGLINKTPIPKEHKQNFKKWDWDLIEEILAFPDKDKPNIKLELHEKHKENKIYKYLLRFYSHTRGLFSQLKWHTDHFQYLRVGALLIRNSIIIPDLLPLVKNPPQSQFQCTVSFMGELQKLLQNTLLSFIKSKNHFYSPFFKCLERQLLLYIGLFSENKVGYQFLLCQNNYFQLLYQFIGKTQCSLVIFTLMLYFDFYRQNMNKRVKIDQNSQTSVTIGPLALLKKSVKQGSKELRILSLQIIKLLFKAQLPSFSSDGFKMLIFLLTSKDQQVSFEAVQTIEHLLNQKYNIPIFLSCIIQEESKQKGNFQIMKKKMQNSKSILIRLISQEIGFKFVFDKIPNWLQQQYKKWINIETDQNYCLVLQNLLNQTLNFVKKKQNCYKIQNCKHLYQLGFLYRLPWIIHINEDEVPAYVKMTKNKFILYFKFDAENSDYQNIIEYHEKSIKIGIGMGSMYVDQNLKTTKTKTVKQIQLINMKQAVLYGKKCMMVQDSGIMIYLIQKRDNIQGSIKQQSQSQIFFGFQILRVQIDINIYFIQQNQQLPLHLIQQLTKTQIGLQFLTQKKLLDHSFLILKNKKSKPLIIRSTLWSLGYFGSTKDGIQKLIQKDLVQKIIQMSYSCQILSIRGTCRYILNMFCHSQTGRNYLMSHGFITNKKCLNCYPKKTTQFYQIKEVDLSCNGGVQSHKQVKGHFSLDDKYWQKYYQASKPLQQNQKKLFQKISLLINSLSYKTAINHIKQMMKNNIKMTHSMNLLQNTINMLSYYKFRYEARKNIYSIFQQYVKTPEFNNNVPNKINYLIGQFFLQEEQLNIDKFAIKQEEQISSKKEKHYQRTQAYQTIKKQFA